MKRLGYAALVMLAVTVAGCLEPQPHIRGGDADSVEIEYGGDVARAMPLARQHCAQFERIPRLVESDLETATFECRAR
jgi:hypothetical protein